MLEEAKSEQGGGYSESDPQLSQKFHEAGFGAKSGAAPGAPLFFHPLEAAYLAKIGKSGFKGKTLAQFTSSQKKKDKLFPFAFEVYSRVRSNGRQVRPFLGNIKYLRAYSPGVGRNEDRPSMVICCLPGEPSVKSIAAHIKVAHQARLDLVIACGSQKEMKFYKIAAFNF